MSIENKLDNKEIFIKINKILDKLGKKYPGDEKNKFENYSYRVEYFSQENKLFFSKEVYENFDKEKINFYLWWRRDRDYKLVLYKFDNVEKIILFEFWKNNLDRVFNEVKRLE